MNNHLDTSHERIHDMLDVWTDIIDIAIQMADDASDHEGREVYCLITPGPMSAHMKVRPKEII